MAEEENREGEAGSREKGLEQEAESRTVFNPFVRK